MVTIIKSKHLKKIEGLLRDVKAPSKEDLDRVTMQYKHYLSGDYDKWRLLRFVFAEGLKFKIYDQPFEKVNWWIPFIYQGKYKCKAAHEKMGFRIYIEAENEKEGEVRGKELEKLFDTAINLSMSSIERSAEEALKQGNVIINNRLRYLYDPYAFFRKKAISTNKISKNPKTDW